MEQYHPGEHAVITQEGPREAAALRDFDQLRVIHVIPAIPGVRS